MIPFRDLAEQTRIGAEQCVRDVRFGGVDFVQQFFVLGQFTNQRKNQCGLIGARATDGEGHSITHTATAALMCGCGS